MNSWPWMQCVLAALTAGIESDLSKLTWWVTGSRWSGFTHALLRQRWVQFQTVRDRTDQQRVGKAMSTVVLAAELDLAVAATGR